MKLVDIGERSLVKKILSFLESVPFIGDDSACIPYGDKFILATIDSTWRRTHFPAEMKPKQIGWFVTAISLSDIAAMGGHPLAVLVSIALPKESEEEMVLEIVEGAEECARKYNVHVVGGDTKEHKELTLSGVAIGEVEKSKVLLRKGLEVGNLVAVTGPLGGAGAAYIAIRNKIRGISLDRLLKPTPRIKEGIDLSKFCLATSCMDISDGLASTLYQLSEINGVGFRIYKEKLPIAREAIEVAKYLEMDASSIALFYGGDYELIFGIRREKVEDAIERMGKDKVRIIGEVVEERRITLVRNGEEEEIPDRGFEHFRKENYL